MGVAAVGARRPNPGQDHRHRLSYAGGEPAKKSIVRRDTQESCTGCLQGLAQAEGGGDAEDTAALRRMDRKQRKKKMSNEE